MKSDDNVVDVSVPTKKTKRVKPMYLRLLVLTLAGAAILAVYLWQQNVIAGISQDYENQISALESTISKLEKNSNKDAKKDPSESDKAASVPSDSTKENVQAAVSSQNYAALESTMASTVKVIIAASEGVGDRTPVQAVKDLEYLNSATLPWDFDLPSATITDWQSGDYAAYFPEDSRIIGRAAGGQVVAFTFNASGKITTIFMSVSDELL